MSLSMIKPSWDQSGAGSSYDYPKLFNPPPNLSYSQRFDHGVWQDPTTGALVYSTQSPFGQLSLSGDSGPEDEMCIAFGGNPDATKRRVDQAGLLQAAPIGLGYLAVANYIGDLRTYYCASWDIPGSRYARSAQFPEVYYGLSTSTTGQVNTVDAAQSLGGFTPKFLTHGNYYRGGLIRAGGVANNAWFTGGGAAGNVGAHSSYSYRCQAVHGQMGSANDTNMYPAHYTRPLVKTTLCAPLFKTDKLIGGRAIAADCFFRSYDDITNIRPGFGVYDHKEGYNVLYADAHAAWYGDPQQQIMWYTYGPRTDGRMQYDSYNSPRVGTAAGLCVDVTVSGANGFVSGRADIYHLFDLATGIDVGNKPLP
jgi:prepilin-type processing-associated H-X9-DG protein